MFIRAAINNLTSDSANLSLSAAQGKALKTLIDNLPAIVDNLTTNDATKPLSAKQGKVLNDKIGGLLIFKTGIKDGSTANGATISFDVPFPTACLIVIPVPDGAYDGTYIEAANIINKTASGFEWHGALIGSGGANVTGAWLAVGY